ncbi:MAG: hypothetical protein NVSMB46_01810 [Candidatus Saccharimonadales bacterium]
MNESTLYNGWTNRETWLVSLWLNDVPAGVSVLQDAYARHESNFARADWLQEQINDEMYNLDLGASLWSDLLSTSLAKVNWLEVIEDNES